MQDNDIPIREISVGVIKVAVKINTMEHIAILDSRTEVSMLSDKLYELINEKSDEPLMTLPIHNLTIIGITGRKNKNIKKQTMVQIEIDKTQIPIIFLVADGISVDLLIGCDMLKLYQCRINIKNNIAELDYENVTYKTPILDYCIPEPVELNNIKETNVLFQNNNDNVNNVTLDHDYEKMILLENKFKEILTFQCNNPLHMITEKQKYELIHVYDKYQNIFSNIPKQITNFEIKLKI